MVKALCGMIGERLFTKKGAKARHGQLGSSSAPDPAAASRRQMAQVCHYVFSSFSKTNPSIQDVGRGPSIA